MRHFKKLLFWEKHLSWKLIMINGLVIVILIWLAGVSVKDFACEIVDEFGVGEGNGALFNETMQLYLIRASLTAGVAAVIVHYMFVKKLLSPLVKLTESTRLLAKGEYPEPIETTGTDEIGRLALHFNEMAKTLQSSEQNRKRLLGNISHELRTPLSNFNGYLEALTNGVIEGNRELYESLYEESQHLTKLVNQLHDLTVWEAGAISEEEMAVVDLKELMLQAVHSFQLEFQKKSIAMHVEADAQQIFVHERGIKQILNNLLANALMYNTGEEVRVIGKAEQDYYRISVSNIGEFIPEEAANLVFERFFRADASRYRDKNKAGTGLGLAIVREIAEQLGGEAGLNTDGHMHSFWVTIPFNNRD